MGRKPAPTEGAAGLAAVSGVNREQARRRQGAGLEGPAEPLSAQRHSWGLKEG